MADIDPRVLTLLDALLKSEASALGAIAIARIEAAEDDASEEGDTESRDPFAPVGDEAPNDRARRQIALADIAIKSVLKRELALIERSAALAETLGNTLRPTAERTGGFRLVVVPAPKARGERLTASPTRIDLLSDDRRRALAQLLKAWIAAAEAARTAIDSEGERGA